ncbi:B12-binding domain-containing radical SAM protein [Miniphocaeibacter massiliensis]|uniref:B12-binding domain-containing radical SAM protein n=1 Tax=Miniphocaeibacter massiliensis TaxID=2041841 RepID=UPI000C0842C3|nr:B12-binding domain-containing radical SAM protein [Miniphocaeibacter massiliensis]
MKILLTSLNTKYIHSNIAIQYLKSTIENKYEVKTIDFTINQNLDDIIYEIIKGNYNIVGFSTYIWNIEQTLKISKKIKKINNKIKIVLGGPEVSYDSRNILKENKFIDFIMCGEGETTFPILMDYINGEKIDLPSGTLENKEFEILGNEIFQTINDLKVSEFEYTEKYLKDKKIVYYETSRGCPYNCEFCLSSSTKKVRYFNLDRCKSDIGKFIDLKVPLVKFIDRTFNFNKEHALEIIKFIINNDKGYTTFHLEIHPTLIDNDYLELFKISRKDLFQFEIGVQSTNMETCKAIKRVGEFEDIKRVCEKLLAFDNIHLHLDLIAGLPYENYKSLKKSFNDILSIRPDKLQLGFLKVLKGSDLWLKNREYKIVYDDYPPYEVISTKWISYEGLQKVKEIEELVDKYYNEKNFYNTFEYIVKNYYKDDFSFFEEFSKFWEERGYYLINHSRDSLYKILLEFVIEKEYENIDIITELLIHDYIMVNRKIPYFLEPNLIDKNSKHEILKNDDILNILPEKYKEVSTKKLVKNIHILKYENDIIRHYNKNQKKYLIMLYDIYNSKNYDVTQKYEEII